jgi:secreted trypsin-like serine protease
MYAAKTWTLQTFSNRRRRNFLATSAAFIVGATLLAQPGYAITFPTREANSVEKQSIVPILTKDGSTLRQSCTGTIVSNVLILTAAHCVIDTPRYNIVVGSPGSTIAQILNRTAEVREVVVVGYHSSYLVEREGRYGTNDIAILRIAQPFSQYRPAKIPTTQTAKQVLTGEMVILGYGVDQNYNSPGRLMAGQARDYSSEGSRITPSFNPETQVAAGYYREADRVFVGACSGDSGGALMGTINGEAVVIGVTSYGSADCAENKPSFFMRASFYKDFIVNSTSWYRDNLQTVMKTNVNDALCDSVTTNYNLYSCLDADISNVTVTREMNDIVFTYSAKMTSGTNRLANVQIDTNNDRQPEYTIRTDGVYDTSGRQLCATSNNELRLPASCIENVSFNATLIVSDSKTVVDYLRCSSLTSDCPRVIAYATDTVELGLTFAGPITTNVDPAEVIDVPQAHTPAPRPEAGIPGAAESELKSCVTVFATQTCYQYPKWQVEACSVKKTMSFQRQTGSRWATLRNLNGTKDSTRCTSQAPYFYSYTDSTRYASGTTITFRFYARAQKASQAVILPVTVVVGKDLKGSTS